MDLSGDEEDQEGARGLPGSDAREIVQGYERQLAAQGAAQQGQAAWQAVVEDSDVDEGTARGAHPGSPPRSGAQQQAEGEEESPPRARRGGRPQRKRQQPAAGQPEEQQAAKLSASPAEAKAAAGSDSGCDSPATTLDVGGSAAEETDGEVRVGPGQGSCLQCEPSRIPLPTVATCQHVGVPAPASASSAAGIVLWF